MRIDIEIILKDENGRFSIEDFIIRTGEMTSKNRAAP